MMWVTLVLLLGITGSGLAMRYVARTDIVALKKFTLPVPVEDRPVDWVHVCPPSWL